MFVLPQNAPLTVVHAHVFDAKNALFKIRVKPLPGQAIVITDNNQVNPGTKFLE